MVEFPDWLRGFVLLGKDGDDFRILGVDENGYLGAILKAAAEVTIPGGVNVTQEDSTRTTQGLDGVTLRTIAVDANGQIIMVPRGSTGNYMSVDASGFLTAILKGQIEGAGLESIAVDAAGQLIMVPRGSTGNYMTIDASGFMATLMKGAYGEVLKTISVDDDGNMISILKDTGDQWGEKISVGLGELAARMGSPVTWDRRGQVVQCCDFSEGMGQIVTSKLGTGADIEIYPGVFQFGGYSLMMTTGAQDGGHASVNLYTVFSKSTCLGVQVSISSAGRPDEIIIKLNVYDGSTLHEPRIRFLKSTGKLQYENNIPTWVDICAAVPAPFINFFFTVKFVVDVSAKKWVRVLYAGSEYDLSAYDYVYDDSAVAPYCYSQVQGKEGAATGHTFYLDHLVITANEP